MTHTVNFKVRILTVRDVAVHDMNSHKDSCPRYLVISREV